MRKQFISVVMVSALILPIALVAGCTSNTTGPSASTCSLANATNLSASEFSDRYLSAYNDTIVTPFSKTTNERGHIVYTGVTNSSSGEGINKVTVELCKSEADAQQTFQQQINAARLKGYVQSYTGNGTWEGTKRKDEATDYVITINMVSPASSDFNALGVGYVTESFEGAG